MGRCQRKEAAVSDAFHSLRVIIGPYQRLDPKSTPRLERDIKIDIYDALTFWESGWIFIVPDLAWEDIHARKRP
jgi:hypothetical protein